MPQPAKIIAGVAIALASGALVYISFIAATELRAHSKPSTPTTTTSVDSVNETEKKGNSLQSASNTVELNPEIPENIKSILDNQETEPEKLEEKPATTVSLALQPKENVKVVQKVQSPHEEVNVIENIEEPVTVMPVVSQPAMQVAPKSIVNPDCGIECQRLKSKDDLEREAMATMSNLIWECNRLEKLNTEKKTRLREQLVQFKANSYFRDQNKKLMNCLTELSKTI